MPLWARAVQSAVMRWIRRPWVPIVLIVLAFAPVDVRAMGAAANRAKRGAAYAGDGRQAHFVLKGYPRTFGLRFNVTPDGSWVRQARVWGLIAACGPGRFMQPSPVVGSTPIRRDGTFRTGLRDTTAGAQGSPVTLTGRFLSGGRASGMLRYRGRGGFKGCNADGTWTAHGDPVPRVKHFAGTTTQGTGVSFERTVERRAHVMRFDFGLLRAHLRGQPQSSCGTVKVASGVVLGPATQFSLPVRHGRFRGVYDDGGIYSVAVAGRIDARSRASGTVSYADRTCVTGTVGWTAQLSGRSGQNSVVRPEARFGPARMSPGGV